MKTSTSSSTLRNTRRLLALESLEDRLALSADLNVLSLNAPILAAKDVSVVFTVRNQGTSTAAAHVDRLFLSKDATFDSSDIALIGQAAIPAVPAGFTYPVSFKATLPANVPTGVYRLIAVTDAGNTVAESNEANNFRVGRAIPVIGGSIQTQAAALQDQLQGLFGDAQGTISASVITAIKGGGHSVTFSFDSSAEYQFRGLRIRDVQFTASIVNGVVTGTGSAKLELRLPAGGIATANVTLAVANNVAKVAGNVTLNGEVLGNQFAVTGGKAVVDLSANLASGTISGNVKFEADSAAVFATQAVSVKATLTGIKGTLDSTGNVSVSVTSLSGKIDNKIDLTASNVTLKRGPSVPASEPLLTVGTATLKLPVSAGKVLTVTATSLKIHATGKASADLVVAGIPIENATLAVAGNTITATGTYRNIAAKVVLELVGTTVQGTLEVTLGSLGRFKTAKFVISQSNNVVQLVMTKVAGTGLASSEVSGTLTLLINPTILDKSAIVAGRTVSVPAKAVRIDVNGSLKLGRFTLTGRLEAVANANGLTVSSIGDLKMDLGKLGKYKANGSVTVTNAGVVGSLAVTREARTDFDITGTLSLKVNTTGSEANGLDANTVRVAIEDLKVKFSNAELTGSGAITASSNGRFKLEVSGVELSTLGGNLKFIATGSLDSAGNVDLAPSVTAKTPDVGALGLGFNFKLTFSTSFNRLSSGAIEVGLRMDVVAKAFVTDLGGTRHESTGFSLLSSGFNANSGGTVSITVGVGPLQHTFTFNLSELTF